MRRLICATALVCAACGSGDDSCGPGDAPAAGAALATDRGTVTYGGFTSSPNNDCPHPQGELTALTIDGTQVGVDGFFLTFCIPRPELIEAGEPIALGLTDDDLVRLVNVNAELDGCLVALDRAAPPPATITFHGWCDDGGSSAGYAIELAGTIELTITCGGDTTALTATAGGGPIAVDAL